MKNLKFSLFAMVLTIVAISFTSCGDESEDPQPLKKEVKTDLEIVKTEIIGTWKIESGEVTKDGTTMTFNDGGTGCNIPAGAPDWFISNKFNSDYGFLPEKDNVLRATIFRWCHGTNGTLYSDNEGSSIIYKITETNGKIIVEVNDGFKFELLSEPENLKEKTMKVKSLNLLKGATSATYVLKKI